MEKQEYRFFGSECQIGSTKLEQLGATINLDPAEALNALRGGAQLCPQSKFPFSDEETKLYPFPAFRAAAPDEFKAKYHTASLVLSEHLQELQDVLTPLDSSEAK